MKKQIFGALLALILASAGVHAYQSVSESIYTASFTATNETARYIPGTRPGTELFGIAIASPSSAGQFTIFDSSGVNVSSIVNVGMGTDQNPQFFIRVSSGLTYTTTNNSGGVTIMYRNPNTP